MAVVGPESEALSYPDKSTTSDDEILGVDVRDIDAAGFGTTPPVEILHTKSTINHSSAIRTSKRAFLRKVRSVHVIQTGTFYTDLPRGESYAALLPCVTVMSARAAPGVEFRPDRVAQSLSSKSTRPHPPEMPKSLFADGPHARCSGERYIQYATLPKPDTGRNEPQTESVNTVHAEPNRTGPVPMAWWRRLRPASHNFIELSEHQLPTDWGTAIYGFWAGYGEASMAAGTNNKITFMIPRQGDIFEGDDQAAATYLEQLKVDFNTRFPPFTAGLLNARLELAFVYADTCGPCASCGRRYDRAAAHG